MIVVAGNHIRASADHRRERLRTALEVDELDLDAGLFVFAELLREHGRQIAEAAGAPDRDLDARLSVLGGRRARGEQQHGQCGRQHARKTSNRVPGRSGHRALLELQRSQNPTPNRFVR